MTPAQLNRAIKSGDVLAYFLPRMSLSNFKTVIVGAEALLAWKRPELEYLNSEDMCSPGEDGELVSDISWCALSRGIRLAQDCVKYGFVLQVAVNVSPEILKEPRFTDRLYSAVRECNVECSGLTLGIAQNAFLRDAGSTYDLLHRLRFKGFGVCLDGFGVTYSPLRLIAPPFNEVKISRSLVSEIGRNKSSETIICEAVVCAHSLGIKVYAEGVDTDDAAAFLSQC